MPRSRARISPVPGSTGSSTSAWDGRSIPCPSLPRSRGSPSIFIFIDADKVNTLEYFEWALRMSRIGSLIIVDNVVRNGAVADEASTDVSVQAMRRFFSHLTH